jgi:hypothetical protein
MSCKKLNVIHVMELAECVALLVEEGNVNYVMVTVLLIVEFILLGAVMAEKLPVANVAVQAGVPIVLAQGRKSVTDVVVKDIMMIDESL